MSLIRQFGYSQLQQYSGNSCFHSVGILPGADVFIIVRKTRNYAPAYWTPCETRTTILSRLFALATAEQTFISHLGTPVRSERNFPTNADASALRASPRATRPPASKIISSHDVKKCARLFQFAPRRGREQLRNFGGGVVPVKYAARNALVAQLRNKKQNPPFLSHPAVLPLLRREGKRRKSARI